MNCDNKKRTFLGQKTVIRTRDFKSSCTFYKEVLGLEIAESWNNDLDCGCIFSTGGSGSIEISYLEPGHDYFRSVFTAPASLKMDIQLATKDMDGWVNRLSPLWEYKGPVSRPWGTQYLYLRDPDDVQIIIYSV